MAAVESLTQVSTDTNIVHGIAVLEQPIELFLLTLAVALKPLPDVFQSVLIRCHNVKSLFIYTLPVYACLNL